MFDGATYQAEFDFNRLKTQLDRVKYLMLDSRWRTLGQIQVVVGGSEAAISARLRDLRKGKFGAYRVDRRRVDESGLFEYRILPCTE